MEEKHLELKLSSNLPVCCPVVRTLYTLIKIVVRWMYNTFVFKQPFSKLEAIHKISNNDTGRNNDNTNCQQQIAITVTPVNNQNN